jgi:hypothetical protein
LFLDSEPEVAHNEAMSLAVGGLAAIEVFVILVIVVFLIWRFGGRPPRAS